ncbi:diacylglycerol/lipid kinase family protein [Rossellomorea marisflavi]|uniref:diacylglycerol/lipid kinase family protein n=1 Tax=Rossellomorea marisflavi TaxID=189381 RepID=UPI00203D4493|nr:diacylglycerol kinase family protein [Rossellomorea marisflavi]MCM2589059.1 diacylglycerol kinase family lipid kinase [Rossellomorea marisflavi]
MKEAMIIINPSSGKEEAVDYKKKAIHNLEGYEVFVRETKGEGDATLFAEEACERGFDLIICMGGDGTVNEVINGMAEKPHRPELALVPLGTVNDFARAISLPLEPEEALEVLKSTNTREADIGKVNDRYFINIIAVGALAEASFSATAEQKSKLGPLAYVVEGMKKMKEKQPFPLELSGEQNWSGDSLLTLIAMTNSIGGFESIAPEAEVDDGSLHVYIIEDMPIPKFLLLLPKILAGKLTESPQVHHLEASEIEASSSFDMKANIDGDEGCTLPLTVKSLPRHVKIRIPEGGSA